MLFRSMTRAQHRVRLDHHVIYEFEGSVESAAGRVPKLDKEIFESSWYISIFFVNKVFDSVTVN